MNAKTLLAVAGLVAPMIVPRAAHAAYTGLSVTSVNSTVTLDPDVPAMVDVPVTIYRVWANFTDPNDALLSWGGGDNLGPCIINNISSTGSGPGSGFLNDINGSVLPPTSNSNIAARDSYFTIGITTYSQIPPGLGIVLTAIGGVSDVTGTTVILRRATESIVTQGSLSNGAPNPITLAGFTGDGDAQLRVLLMQLTVRKHEFISGQIGLRFRNSGGTPQSVNQPIFFEPPIGTCCLPDSCVGSLPGPCEADGGVFLGLSQCSVCLGACCTDSGCAVMTSGDCAKRGGKFHGPGSTCGSACLLGDINGDKSVDVDDLLAVIAAWGPCAFPCPPCPANLDANCTVNVSDLLVVIENWSP